MVRIATRSLARSQNCPVEVRFGFGIAELPAGRVWALEAVVARRRRLFGPVNDPIYDGQEIDICMECEL